MANKVMPGRCAGVADNPDTRVRCWRCGQFFEPNQVHNSRCRECAGASGAGDSTAREVELDADSKRMAMKARHSKKPFWTYELWESVGGEDQLLASLWTRDKAKAMHALERERRNNPGAKLKIYTKGQGWEDVNE